MDYYYQMTGQKLEATYYTTYINDEALLPLLKEHHVEIDRRNRRFVGDDYL